MSVYASAQGLPKTGEIDQRTSLTKAIGNIYQASPSRAQAHPYGTPTKGKGPRSSVSRERSQHSFDRTSQASKRKSTARGQNDSFHDKPRTSCAKSRLRIKGYNDNDRYSQGQKKKNTNSCSEKATKTRLHKILDRHIRREGARSIV